MYAQLNELIILFNNWKNISNYISSDLKLKKENIYSYERLSCQTMSSRAIC